VQTNHILRIESLSKHFDGVHALSNANFELLEGEIHALAGENGAGKSTLIKILSGIHSRDDGQILLDGEEVRTKTPAESRQLGISVIYQDFDLAPNLSITDNLLLGQEPPTVFGLINSRERNRLARSYLELVGLEIDQSTLVERLTVAQRQLVAIARALSQHTRILVMDEPTSALASDEIKHLLELLVKLKEKGTSIIFVSHKLDEIFRVSDRITVFRDGKTVGARETRATTENEIVSMMVGRDLEDLYSKDSHIRNEPLLEVKGIAKAGVFDAISFSLNKGEILGIYGLKGAGRSEMVKALFGLESADAGTLVMEGQAIRINTPRDAIKHGMAFVPEDRKTLGLFPNMDVKENLSISALGRLSGHGFVKRGKELETAADYIERLNIQTTGPEQMISGLSGGNQQKVMLARWLMNDPRVLILDEPTAGIDVGAKSEIYKVMDQLVSRGMGIVLVSSDLPEILGLSDHILVMHGGSIVARFPRGEASEEKVMHSIHS
jgi:ABC-type sugar transport system ATPase subunit